MVTLFLLALQGLGRPERPMYRNDVNSTWKTELGFICVNTSYTALWKASFVYNWKMKISYLQLWRTGFFLIILYSTGLNISWKRIFIVGQVEMHLENNCLSCLYASADIKPLCNGLFVTSSFKFSKNLFKTSFLSSHFHILISFSRNGCTHTTTRTTAAHTSRGIWHFMLTIPVQLQAASL